ncbi:MAG: hypothetical protein LC135_15300 [Phycisphaerae bacterium]|nr:hypothetical protein [Phycisphaerae bacterium]MCZ2401206.1 hypothetical protein [Phycisphaerae bacterium]
MTRALLSGGLVLALAVALIGCPELTPDPNNPAGSDTKNPDDGEPNGGATSNGNDDDDDDDDQPATPIVNPAVYGDGSAGSVVILFDQRLGDDGNFNTQFVDFTVAQGVTLTVQSGTVIRCTGRFQNWGRIVVQHGADGAGRSGIDSSSLAIATQEAAAGIATRAAGSGEVGSPSAERSGGGGGQGLSQFESAGQLIVAVKAGGAGGASMTSGGTGGGGFLVLAGGELLNAGEIRAPGGDGAGGSGGGAGGLVVLASLARVENASGASIVADGGAGGASTSDSGPGGGGGGGIVHLFAPVVVADGAVSVAGGAPGEAGPAGSVTASLRSGGGGGGAAGGSGGRGGAVSSGDTGDALEGQGGGQGFFIQSRFNPTAWF